MHPSPPASNKRPNPQGKGLVPILRDWEQLGAHLPAAKTATQFLRDYCLSSLVIAASFKFKPVQGRCYFLYATDAGFVLSLITPGEWGKRLPGPFLAACRLRPDMTWDLDFTALDPASPAAQNAMTFVESFVAALGAQESVVAELPFYVSTLPYYQRLLATAMASSLSHSAAISPVISPHSLSALLQHRPGLAALTSVKPPSFSA